VIFLIQREKQWRNFLSQEKGPERGKEKFAVLKKLREKIEGDHQSRRVQEEGLNWNFSFRRGRVRGGQGRKEAGIWSWLRTEVGAGGVRCLEGYVR